ncbi:alpha/beta fold hydrolase [Isoalcanivorax beigongshangi]|uniref:Alpha/beta fold hydrolase n=1 Tax=Isoalcanivorax beigongshangi TaxID=3238810 RepID=A0ABV4AKQ4_9GAMM
MTATLRAPAPPEGAKHIVFEHRGLQFPALMRGDGEPVVLLHGFPDCHLNWEGWVTALADAGFCAVAPALRGYAPDCLDADGDYSLAAAVDDLLALVAQLGGRAHLVGHDWGAVVAQLAAAAAPEAVQSLTSLAIPPLRRLPQAALKVPRQLRASAYMGLFQLPQLPEWLLARDQQAAVPWLWRRWSPDWEPGAALERAQHALAAPGVLSAALSWYRHLPRVWLASHRQARRWLARPLAVPTLLLVGRKDGCMLPELLPHAVQGRDFPAGVELETVAGAGHFLHLERPERCLPVVIGHLRRHGSGGL